MKPILLARGSGKNDGQFELILMEYNEELGRHTKTNSEYFLDHTERPINYILNRAYMDLDTMDELARAFGFEPWEVELI